MLYNQLLLKEFLHLGGYHNVITVADAESAMQALDANKIDLILLDLYLPGKSGLMLCKELKENPKTKDIPIIIQTSSVSSSDKAKAFAYGANDFLLKPLDQIDILARINNQLRQQELYRQIISAKNRMADDLAEAVKMLFSLLPDLTYINQSLAIYHAQIAAACNFSSDLGGDFYYIQNQNEKIFICSWDFAGHGIVSAINTFRLHSIIQNSNINSILNNNNTLENWFNKLNYTLYHLLDRSNYATGIAITVDLQKKHIEYISAASHGVLLLDFQHSNYAVMYQPSLPLGVKENHTYQTQYIDLSKYEAIAMFSDALVETTMEHDKFYSLDDIAQSLLDIQAKYQYTNYQELVDHFINLFINKSINGVQDDLTLLIIGIKP